MRISVLSYGLKYRTNFFLMLVVLSADIFEKLVASRSGQVPRTGVECRLPSAVTVFNPRVELF
jgi:hypothetical protein